MTGVVGLKPPPPRRTPLSYVQGGEPDDCWAWTGPINKHRRNRPLWMGGNSIGNASRAVWIALHGAPPEGFHVEHLCENHLCVNPSHLRPVPPEVNYARLRRTHCARGHELVEANRVPAGEYAPGKLRYKCRACTNVRQIRYDEAKRQKVGRQP